MDRSSFGVRFGKVLAEDTLTGSAVEKAGSAKAGGSVDLLGPTDVCTENGPQGTFAVTVSPGCCPIRIRDGENRM